MIELYSLTGTKLSADIKDRIGDTGAVQITDTMITRWANAAVRSITSRDAYLEKTVTGNAMAGVATYDIATTFASPRVKSIEQVAFKGTPLQIVPAPEWRTLIDGRDLEADAGDPEYAMFFGEALTLWPVPSSSEVSALTLYYLAYPDEITDLTEVLPLPDRYYNAIADYVFAQALQQLEKFEESKLVLANHETHLQHQFEGGRESPTDYYPTISYDPDSHDRPYA